MGLCPHEKLFIILVVVPKFFVRYVGVHRSRNSAADVTQFALLILLVHEGYLKSTMAGNGHGLYFSVIQLQ